MSSTTLGMTSTTLGMPGMTFGKASMIFGTRGEGLNMATDPAKLKDYTFENLKNRVRRATKPEKKENKKKGEVFAATDEK